MSQQFFGIYKSVDLDREAINLVRSSTLKFRFALSAAFDELPISQDEIPLSPQVTTDVNGVVVALTLNPNLFSKVSPKERNVFPKHNFNDPICSEFNAYNYVFN